MSEPKSNSCGSCAAATTRTPSAISSVDGWVLGSVPVGRRLSTTTSCPASASAVARWCTWRPSPPITTGGYSHDTIRTFIGAARQSSRASRAPNRPVGAVPAIGQSLSVLAAARGQRARDLPGGMRVQMGAIARIVCGGILADHERPVAGHRQQRLAQNLVGDEVPWRRRAQRRTLLQRLVHGGQRGVDDFAVQLDQVGHLLAGPHLPVLARTPRAGRQFDRCADEAVGDRIGQCADPHAGRRQRTQHPLQPDGALVPPVAEQFGVEGRDDVSGPADPLALGDEPLPDHVDEIGDVDVDGAVGALRVVWRLGVRRHIAAGDAGRLETGDVVVGVEVAVGGVAGVAGLRRPHPVADLQVAAECDHVGCADRPAQRGVAAQRRSVDHEVADTRCGVIDFHAGRVRTFGRPDACSAYGRSAAGRRPAPRAARTPATADSAAAGTDAPAGRRAVRWCRRRSAHAAAGCRRGATA